MTLGREFLTTRDAKRAKAQLEAGKNSIWKPDFNKGQLLPAVLLLENLNLLQYLSVKGKRGREKGKEKTFNLFPKPNSELKMLNRAVLHWNLIKEIRVINITIQAQVREILHKFNIQTPIKIYSNWYYEIY